MICLQPGCPVGWLVGFGESEYEVDYTEKGVSALSVCACWCAENKSRECGARCCCHLGMPPPAKAENVPSPRYLVNHHHPLSWCVKQDTSGWETFQRTSEKIE